MADPVRPAVDAVFTRLKSEAFHDLVERARRGDRTAAATLVTWLQPAITRYCRARIGRTGSAFSTADDVAQEIIFGILKALPRFADTSDAFLPFIYGIAANKVRDHYRRSARDHYETVAEIPDVADSGPGPEQLAERGELTGRMTAVLATLVPRQREILILRLVVGLSGAEIALALRMSPTAVRVAQHRALTKLRAKLRPEDWL